MMRGHVLLALVCALAGSADAQFAQQGGKLVGIHANGNSEQGYSVALSADGSTAIVGGPTDGDANAGAAWVYTRSAGVWTQQGSKLVGTGVAAGSPARQGYSVALSADGNTALVGGAGAAWVYTRSGGVWTQQAGNLVGIGVFPVALSADGNTAIVGGTVYTRSGGVWTLQGNIPVGTGAVGNESQGWSAALSGDGNTAIVGGPQDNTGVGAAWVYTRSGGVWTQQGSKLVGTGAVGNANQGYSVALSSDGNTAIVGGPWDNTVNTFDPNYGAGAAWVYKRSGGVWTQLGSKLVGTGVAGLGLGYSQGAEQGYSVALSSDGYTAIVGGPFDGPVPEYHGGYAGAAWVFVSAPTTPAKPAITGIVNDADFTAGGAISTGSWVAIFGTGLAPSGDSRTWNAATEIVNGKLPVSLDDTLVVVNGKPASVEFIQPSQVNIQTPDDTTIGPVQVIVNTAAGATDAFTVNYATFAPGLFPAVAPYIVAQHADTSYVTTAAPAKPGEVIILWGTGFGPANPAVPAGLVFSGANRLANTVTVTVGGQPATVDFAGVVGAGLVQINVHVPLGINNGDAPIVATVGGASTQTTANMISIHNEPVVPFCGVAKRTSYETQGRR